MIIRKVIFLGTLFFISIFFIGCQDITFSGSQTGNNTQFIVDFDVLNTTKSHKLPLKTGDSVSVTITKESGNLEIYVYDSNKNYIYRSNRALDSKFTLTVNHNDDYTFEIKGDHNAKGKVIFKKIN